MRPFDSNLLHAELDSLEGAVTSLRSEIAERSDGATASAYALSQQLYESGLRVFIHCANHAETTTAATAVGGDEASEMPENATQRASYSAQEAPKHIASRHASVRLLQYLWRRHIDRWLGPAAAIVLTIAAVVGLIVLVLMAGIDTVTSPHL